MTGKRGAGWVSARPAELAKSERMTFGAIVAWLAVALLVLVFLAVVGIT